MAGVGRLELPTFRLTGEYSTIELHPNLAEGVGFEPTEPVKALSFSKTSPLNRSGNLPCILYNIITVLHNDFIQKSCYKTRKVTLNKGICIMFSRLILFLVLSLFCSQSFGLYLPAKHDSEVSFGGTIDYDSMKSAWVPGQRFDYEKIMLSAHLLKKSIHKNFDIVTNYHLAHKKGVIQTQLTYHLCCEKKDLIFLSLSGGLNTNIKAHGGGGVEIHFDNVILFSSLTHRKEFRGGLIWYMGKEEQFHIGAIADVHFNKEHNNPGDPKGISTHYGLIVGFKLDSKGQKVIDNLSKELSKKSELILGDEEVEEVKTESKK